jgi:hypothetical protein
MANGLSEETRKTRDKGGRFRQMTTLSFLTDNAHVENRYSDFDRDPLTYFMLSAEGPALCAGDFNGDGELDFYRGGARGQAGRMNLYTRGSYFSAAEATFADDAW